MELVEARLDSAEGWAAAVDCCSTVWHLASPNPPSMPADESEVIRPAVEGTLRVLRAAAASGTVRRVVLTSSTDAVTRGRVGDGSRVLTEADWSDPTRSGPYPRSKVHAERAAWEFTQDHPLELVTINPGLVLGPILHAERGTSVEVVRRLMKRELPAVPRLGFAVVDVRDVARAHRLAMEIPAAAGNRYIVAGRHLWMGEIAAMLAAEFGPRGYRVPTRSLPYWMMWVLARFDATVRLAVGYVGVATLVSADKAHRELGWTARPAEATLSDTVESLLHYCVIPRSRTDAAARKSGNSLRGEQLRNQGLTGSVSLLRHRGTTGRLMRPP